MWLSLNNQTLVGYCVFFFLLLLLHNTFKQPPAGFQNLNEYEALLNDMEHQLLQDKMMVESISKALLSRLPQSALPASTLIRMQNQAAHARLASHAQNFLFIGINRAASSSFFRVFSNVATQYWHNSVESEFRAVTSESCRSNTRRSWLAWNASVARNQYCNDGHRVRFLSSPCFRSFMVNPEDWPQHTRPVVVTMIRNPMDRFFSSYRVYLECCRKSEEWCKQLCKSHYNTSSNLEEFPVLEAFLPVYCNRIGCNSQSTALEMDKERVDWILLSDRFEESICLFAVKFNLPLHVLFFHPVRFPRSSPLHSVPALSQQVIAKLESTFDKDILFYERARAKLEEEIKNLSSQETTKFQALRVELAKGNQQQSARCNQMCSISLEMCILCWKLGVCELGIEKGW